MRFNHQKLKEPTGNVSWVEMQMRFDSAIESMHRVSRRRGTEEWGGHGYNTPARHQASKTFHKFLTPIAVTEEGLLKRLWRYWT